MPSAGASAAPFPWGALDRVSRADVEAARAMRAWAATFARTRDVSQTLSALIGAPVEVRVERVRAVARPSGTEDGLAVVLRGAEGNGTALIDVEGALAAALVTRATRRAPPKVVDPAKRPGVAVAGALAAIVAAASRRVRRESALRVIAAGPSSALARDIAERSDAFFEATLAVRVDGEAFAARVVLGRTEALRAPEPAWGRSDLTAMGDALLAIPIVACTTRATASDVGSLRRGDAWLPGAWPLGGGKHAPLAGPVRLAAPASELAFRAELGDDGRLTLRGGTEQLAWTEDAASHAGDRDNRDTPEEHVNEEKDALVEAVGEVPVVVRVEIGIAEMRAREWAALGEGDVIALGRKIGEAVTLRVGGIAVARGELVEIEGEVGVRILGRAAEGAT